MIDLQTYKKIVNHCASAAMLAATWFTCLGSTNCPITELYVT